MKVKELKKINEFAHENGFDLDYKRLLKFDAKDISRILSLIDEESMNVESLINFFEFEMDNSDWKKSFEKLIGIEDFDIREYIIRKLINANSPALSKSIYYYCDCECDGILASFKDVQEYQTYVESITAKMPDNDNIVLSNVQFALERVILDSDRKEAIRNVMEYSQRNDLSPVSLRDYFEYLEFPFDINETLLLLLKGYDVRMVRTLLEKWYEDIKNGDKDKVHGSYTIAKEYLLKSKLFDSSKDNTSLIKIFCETEYKKYSQIVVLLNEVEKSKDRELFDQCLKCCAKLSNENIRYYINQILYAEKSNNDFRQSILYLLENEISENNSAAAVISFLFWASEVDISSKMTAEFIIKVQNINLIKDMPITSKNYPTREVIYREFPKFLSFGDNKLETEYYKELLKRLYPLPADICQKVMDILNLPVVKNMDIEQQNKLRELILNPENHSSLEYINARYIEKQKEYELHCAAKIGQNAISYDSEVPLMTVAELLECDHDIDKVLEGFDDDEEITPRTLIRSLAYKNNQNN